MDFDSLTPDAPTQSSVQSPSPPIQEQVQPGLDSTTQAAPASFDSLQDDSEKYGTTGQQIKAGLEGAAQGIAGPLATLAETELLGVEPEAIRARAEQNPWTHGIGETAGFAGSLLTGVGEGALLAKAGSGAAKLAGLAEAENIGSKLAKSAVTAAAEMGLFQASDEASKAILADPNQTLGSAISNVGLSTALGGATGPLFTGTGMALKSAFNNSGLKEFVDRLAFRKANIDPNEMMKQEFSTAHNAIADMGTEVGGIDGIRAQAMEKLIPRQVTPQIQSQASDLLSKIEKTAVKLAESGDKSGARAFEEQASKLRETLNPNLDLITNQTQTPLDSKSIFDTMNGIKRQLGEWGQFNKALVPFSEIEFRNSAKSIGHELKNALENPKVWDKAGELQKTLNSAWSDLIPAQKDIQSKFMEKIGGIPEISPQKFSTYTNQNGKVTSQSVRQTMMGNYVDAVSKFQDAAAKAYEAAGVENPFQPVGMTALRDSLNKPSNGAKLADLWIDKLGAHSLGNAAAMGVGEAAIPGFVGAYAGEKVLGPIFSAVLKPLMEKYPNVDLNAFKQAFSLLKNISEGNNLVTNAAANLFVSGAKVLPSHLIPSKEDISKLDEKTKEMNSNVDAMSKVPGDVSYYMPDHGTAMAKMTNDAVTYINSQRPMPMKAMPLDTQPEPSPMQKQQFNRTLAVAQQPLIAMQHIKDGTLLPQDVATVKQIYPEYYQKMSQEILNAMTDHLTEENPIPYKVRQGMSLFLGQPLDSTMTPQAIQSAQSVFASQKASLQPQQNAPKASPSKLNKVSDSYLTSDQAAQKRLTTDR